MEKREVDVVIIGGGLTGMTTAFYLKKAGKKVAVIEKENRFGGVIKTVKTADFTFEAGPNTGVYSTPELVRLFDDLDGKCTPEFANQKGKQRWILKNGKWHALPSGPGSAISTPLFSFRDKIRILAEPFRKRGREQNETVAELVKRRMGKSFLDYAVDPFISGIYAGDPDLLVTRYALPKLYNLEQSYGSFIRGAIRKKKEPKDDLTRRATREVFSVKGGLEAIPEALGEAIGKKNICTNASGLKVSRENEKYRSKFFKGDIEYEIHSKSAISSVGGYAIKNIFSFITREQLSPLLDLRYAKVVQVVAAYRNWEGIELNAFGGLIPGKEDHKILGILFPSSIFKNRAPEKGAILSVFMGGMRHPELIKLPDAALKKIVLDEIALTLRAGESEPELLKIYRYPYAIPQYEKSSGERFRTISELEDAFPGLYLAGNIRDGIGMADRVKQGIQTADRILAKENA